MTPTLKFRRKMILALAARLADETREASRFRRMEMYWRWAGALLITAALFVALSHPGSVMGVVALSVAGGFAAGLSAALHSTEMQWPVLKPLLDLQSVQEAIEECRNVPQQ